MDQQDLELQHYLKNWVDQQPLPAGGKVQLITAAATLKEEGRVKPTRPLPPTPNDLISWAMVYCVDRRISMARIVT